MFGKFFFLPHAAWSKHSPVTANTPFMATQLCLFARMFTQLQDVSKLGLHPLKNAKVSHMSQKNESLQSIVFPTQIVWVFVFIWANRLYTRDSHSHLLLNNLWNLGYCCTCCDFCLDWEPTTPKPRTQNWKHPPKTRQDYADCKDDGTQGNDLSNVSRQEYNSVLYGRFITAACSPLSCGELLLIISSCCCPATYFWLLKSLYLTIAWSIRPQQHSTKSCLGIVRQPKHRHKTTPYRLKRFKTRL